MVRKTRAEAQITRQRILDAAAKVFLEQGFSGASLQRVAEAAGFTRGAIYWHFENKKELLQALMARTAPCDHADNAKGADDEASQTLTRLAMAPLVRLKQSAPVQQGQSIPSPAGLSADAVVMGRRMAGEQRALLLLALQLACDKVYRQRDLELGASSRGAALGLCWLIEGLMRRWSKDPGAFDLLGIGSLAISAFVQGMCSGDGSRKLPVAPSGHTESPGNTCGPAAADASAR
jgi:TetR/AcrR family acrAB operon transcriptional repressor